MILGVGVDIVQINRIEKSIKNFGDTFLDKIFTNDEIAFCYKRKDPYPCLAARFAAKEAIIKCLASHLSVPLLHIEVAVSEEGKPSIKAGESLEEAFKKMGVEHVHLSLSHEKKYAVAYAIVESK
ncbi:holo-ACP synthase [Nitrospirota bacterium]